jgi:hypothetical protein
MSAAVGRWLVALLAFTWLTLLGGCGTTPATPRAITLAGVVVDGQRLARADEVGLVGITRGGYQREGRAGAELQAGDTIETGPSAYAVIRYPSGSELFLRPGTRGRVGSFLDLVGEVFAKVRGAFAVQTEFVKAGAEGTAFSMQGTPSGDYALVVFDGTVRMSSLAAAWTSLALGPGAMSAGHAHVAPRTMPAPPEELARARAWVERLETLVPAPRGSSGAGPALAIAALIAVIAASSSRDDTPSAPAGLAIDSPPGRGGFRSCRRLVLRWQPVAGARDYAVRLDAQRSGAWQPVDTIIDAAPPLEVGDRLRASTNYRWQVQARDARGRAGPWSTPMTFGCSSDDVIR